MLLMVGGGGNIDVTSGDIGAGGDGADVISGCSAGDVIDDGIRC